MKLTQARPSCTQQHHQCSAGQFGACQEGATTASFPNTGLRWKLSNQAAVASATSRWKRLPSRCRRMTPHPLVGQPCSAGCSGDHSLCDLNDPSAEHRWQVWCKVRVLAILEACCHMPSHRFDPLGCRGHGSLPWSSSCFEEISSFFTLSFFSLLLDACPSFKFGVTH